MASFLLKDNLAVCYFGHPSVGNRKAIEDYINSFASLFSITAHALQPEAHSVNEKVLWGQVFELRKNCSSADDRKRLKSIVHELPKMIMSSELVIDCFFQKQSVVK